MTFEATDFDVGEGVTEARYTDGPVREIDIDIWHELELRRRTTDDDAEGDEATEARLDRPDEEDQDDYADEAQTFGGSR